MIRGFLKNIGIFRIMKLKDNIKVAFGSINDNKLRTVLTALIIAIGIMALVGILTSIDGMKKSINDNFASMGANSYSIRNRGSGSIRIGGGRAKQKRFDNITFDQAADFKRKFKFPATVSVSSFASFASTAKYNNNKTNPNISVSGFIDESPYTGPGTSLQLQREGMETRITEIMESFER